MITTAAGSSEAANQRNEMRRRPLAVRMTRDWLLLVVGLVPVAVALSVNTGRSTTATVIVCTVSIFSGLRLRHLVLMGRGFALDAAFWLFVLVFVTGPFVAQVGSGVFPLDRIVPYRPSASEIHTAATCLLLGAVGYEAGWRAGPLLRRKRARLATRRRSPLLTHVGARETQILGAFVAATAAAWAVARHGVTPFVTSRQAVEASYYGTGSELRLAHLGTDLAAAGFELQLTRNATALGFLMLVAGRSAVKRAGERRGWGRILFAIALVACGLINGPLAASRTVTLSVVFAWWLLRPESAARPSRYGAIVVAGALGMLVVFPSLDLFRVSGGSASIDNPVSQFTTDLDYTPVEQTMRVAHYVEEDGHTWGRQVLGAAGAFVPRAVWTEKPVSTTYVVSGDTGLVIGTPIWAEGYLEFGYPGALLYPFGLGVIVRHVSQWGRKNPISPASAAALALSVGVCVLLVRGDLLSSAVTVYGVAGVAVVLAAASRLISRQPILAESAA